ncbi:selenocysteine-specific translation elongation factor [Sinosporangium siamense]|uniref:Selenocysteine-specific translation elongation factor n=1 Tax=Sinosporangium siamense TaxID=1367973 RepID=A0A919RL52_9ACTN|nr:selenocysteine-specific translation elongation factor [Sinosporangium siamense]GII95830.1 selenocysteine-specific translation elongation factor [Sinosporangium siamense]
MHVIATAGHVDHGKSTLLRALTGMEPDRWEEEKRRGLTIDLGFVWTGDLAFVDVPGHERFITNMLAGVGAVPAVLFVVAADEGWRVQSQEHLDIVDALGIRHGLLAITRSDLADPGPATREARERLAGTGLADMPALAVSATTGAGLNPLREALRGVCAALPQPDVHADVRLWADRVFTIAGRGTVVTGTLGAGKIRVGDTLTADGRPVHVRGLHSRQKPCDEVRAPARVAVNLRGTVPPTLRRGIALVSPDRWLSSTFVDVRLTQPAGRSADRDRPPRECVWHVGAAAIPARVRMLGDDTARVLVSEGLPLRIGDRALLRDPGSRRIWGTTVLDACPPHVRRKGDAKRRAVELADMDGVPDGAAEVRRRGLVRRADLMAMGIAPPPDSPVVDDWLADAAHWRELKERLVSHLKLRAETSPEDPGLSAQDIQRRLFLPDRALVDRLAADLALHRSRGRFTAVAPTLPPGVAAAVETLHRQWKAVPFGAPTAEELARLGLDAKALAAAETVGLLRRVGGGIVLPHDAVERALEILGGLPQPFTTAQAREALRTTRRIAIPLLEHLDRLGHTRRPDASLRELVRRSLP